jgi:MFS family permease
MWNMGFAFWGAYVIDKFGRRPMMLSSLTGMLCALIGWTVASAIYTTHGTAAAGTAVIPLIFIFTASYSTVWNGILTGYVSPSPVQSKSTTRAIADRNRRYTVEVMSYDIRSKLICTQNLLVQATITGFNYLNPVALENISWKYVSLSPHSTLPHMY